MMFFNDENKRDFCKRGWDIIGLSGGWEEES